MKEKLFVHLTKERYQNQSRSKEIVETWGPSASRDVGIKSRGKISFLVNYCGYTHNFKKPK